MKFWGDLLNYCEIKLERQINPCNELDQWMRKLTFQHKAGMRRWDWYKAQEGLQAAEFRLLSRRHGNSSYFTDHASTLFTFRWEQRIHNKSKGNEKLIRLLIWGYSRALRFILSHISAYVTLTLDMLLHTITLLVFSQWPQSKPHPGNILFLTYRTVVLVC